MALGRNRRSHSEEEVDVDMVPVMNLFLVLIPFLLIAANFINLRVINTSVPVISRSEGKTDKTIKVTVVVELKKGGIRLSAISDSAELTDLNNLEASIENEKSGEYSLIRLASHLKDIKQKFPLSDTLVIVPGGEVLYDTIIQVMDAARYVEKEPLFPNMVLSGKV